MYLCVCVREYVDRSLRSALETVGPRRVQHLIDLLTPQNLILTYIPSTKGNASFPEGSQVFKDRNLKLQYDARRTFQCAEAAKHEIARRS